jgi:hypothetical protein
LVARNSGARQGAIVFECALPLPARNIRKVSINIHGAIVLECTLPTHAIATIDIGHDCRHRHNRRDRRGTGNNLKLLNGKKSKIGFLKGMT